MGPSQDMQSPYAIPSITISPPTSPREGPFPKSNPSFDLETIEETEYSPDSPQEQPSNNLLSPHDYGRSSPHSECSDEQSTSGDELDKLKSVAMRLRLLTRRPSYVEWCENLPKIRDLNWNTKECGCGDEEEEWVTYKQRRENLDEKLQWVRTELIEMKSQDHRLAIQLMRLRSEIQRLKLQKSCHEHRELIDTATEFAEEDRDSQQPALCDPPFRGNGMLFALEKPLKHFGVTRLNLFARRFSLC